MRRPHDPQLVVPENLVVRVLYACHGDKTGGHLGQDKTMSRACLPLHPLTIPCRPFVQFTRDHKHSVLDGRGYKYALMFVDYFTKYVTAYAWHTLSAEETAAHLVKHMCLFGACVIARRCFIFIHMLIMPTVE
jgi:hypothetical protein